MTETEFYHDGMRALQDRFDGRRLADKLAAVRRHDLFSQADVAKIEAASFFMIATSYADQPDCSVRAGDPGFVRVTGPDTIEFPDYDGNSMYRTLGNIARNPRVGLLFAAFDGTSRMRLNGRATLHDDPAVLAQHHGARLVVRVTAEDIFPNCPRYLPGLAAGTLSAHTPRSGEITPVPDWKRIPAITPALPADDPHRARITEP